MDILEQHVEFVQISKHEFVLHKHNLTNLIPSDYQIDVNLKAEHTNEGEIERW